MLAKLRVLAPDVWTVAELVGTGLLVGGVWVQWGGTWACMLLGLGVLMLAAVRAWRAGGHE